LFQNFLLKGRIMQDKTPKAILEWRVVAMGASTAATGFITIDAMRFNNCKKLLMDKCYRKDRIEGTASRYMHPSIRGLYIYISEVEKKIQATADGPSALAQAADDLNLPSYNAG
jgi:hypothetical protein